MIHSNQTGYTQKYYCALHQQVWSLLLLNMYKQVLKLTRYTTAPKATSGGHLSVAHAA